MDLLGDGGESDPTHYYHDYSRHYEYNITNNGSSDAIPLYTGYPRALLNIATVTCIAYMVVGVPGNLLTIVALIKSKKTRNATAVFIMNLSFSDLLFCCFNLPLAASTFWHQAWLYGDVFCRLLPMMRYGLLAVSLFTILAITINRYIMIGHQRLYQRIYRTKNLCLMVAFTWILGFGSLLPTWHEKWGKFGLDIGIHSCSILPDSQRHSPKQFLFLIAFALPCLAIIICYARIFYIVRSTALRTKDLVSENLDDNSIEDVSSAVSNQQQPGQHAGSSATITPEKENPGGLTQQNDHPPPLSYINFSQHTDWHYIDSSTENEIFCSTSSTEDISCRAAGTLNTKLDNNAVDRCDCGASRIPPQTDEGYLDNSNAKPRNQRYATASGPGVRRNASNINARKRKKHLNTSGASIMSAGKMSAKDRKLLQMILVIFLAFLVCYLPITVVKLFRPSMQVLNVVSYLLIYLTTCINPIIYVVMSREYRQAYSDLVLCRTYEMAKSKCKQHKAANVLRFASKC
ncbi:G-protein coupled receptor moody isoform X1 [Anopheles funestus]|uniref:G-protein coupled receptor moody isoform X1 n=1 Tax=Anopheles funestus TaxID=62324 RepID=UPI0020C62858|nr:G-protein coupled receptor moody isoform X1 [Anopheles funestus]XP_049280305.1 G-protein coupled receptor moody isoform X1 [Anopheles funestus]XP_049280306.1 G-protein coupled receptor moody isoform X1 [Anopheles funestus]